MSDNQSRHKRRRTDKTSEFSQKNMYEDFLSTVKRLNKIAQQIEERQNEEQQDFSCSEQALKGHKVLH